MKAILVMREQEPKKGAFTSIEMSLKAKEFYVERYEGISRLCPIDLDLKRAYLTDCEGNYLKLAARMKIRCPNIEIYDMSNGAQRFETDWHKIDPNVPKPESKRIHVDGEPDYDMIEGRPLASIVKFHAEPHWKEHIWNGIHEGLYKSGWNVKVVRMTPAKQVMDAEKSDMVFQWAAKEPQRVIDRQYKNLNDKCLTVCVEHGYWQRNKYCVLMPSLTRTSLNGSVDPSIFKVAGRKKREYWVIPMQVSGDEQIKDLEQTKPIWDWVTDMYHELKRHTDKPVKVRPHPVRSDEARNCRIPQEDILGLGNGDRWTENTIGRDLKAAYGIVSYNSTMIADGMLHDVPVIQMGKREETEPYTFHEISKEIAEDVENKGKKTQALLRGYKKIVPQLAGQQKDYEALCAYDWNKFYKEYAK